MPPNQNNPASLQKKSPILAIVIVVILLFLIGGGIYEYSTFISGSKKISAGQTTCSVSQASVPQTSTATLSDGTRVSISASLLDACSDHAGSWDIFHAGNGSVVAPYVADDWHWKFSVNSTKDISINSIDIIYSVGKDYWSTADSGKYPIVVLQNGSQLNTNYGQVFNISSSSSVYDLYGQVESRPFINSTLSVTFSDGTIATTSITAMPSIVPAN